MPLTSADAPGNSSGRTCDACGRSESFAGFYSVPGAAVTIGWCHPCIQRGCQPMFTLEAYLCDMHPEAPELDKNLPDSIAAAKTFGMPRDMGLAEWYLEEFVWVDGDYVTIRDYVGGIWDAA